MKKYLNVTVNKGYMIPVDGLSDSDIKLISDHLNTGECLEYEIMKLSANSSIQVLSPNNLTVHEVIVHGVEN